MREGERVEGDGREAWREVEEAWREMEAAWREEGGGREVEERHRRGSKGGWREVEEAWRRYVREGGAGA